MKKYHRSGIEKLKTSPPIFTLVSASLLLCLLLLSLLAAAPFQEPAPTPTALPQATPTPAATPAPSTAQVIADACDKGNYNCVLAFWNTYHWWILLFVAGFAALLIISSFFEGFREIVKEIGKRFSSWLGSKLRFRKDPTHDYLVWFTAQYQDPKFGALSLRRYTDKQPARLEDIYLPVEVSFELTADERQEMEKSGEDEAKGKEVFREALRQPGEALGLSQALKRQPPVLVIIGIPGSGKSTLLQWLGLVNTHSLLGKKIKGQKEVIKAQGGKLFPIFVSLGSYDRYCQDRQLERTAASLVDYLTDRYTRACEPQVGKKLSAPFPADFFTRKMKDGCLLLFDGMDEVDPEHRQAVRSMLSEVQEGRSARSHILISARPPAAGEAQVKGARRGDMLALSKPLRDQLIRNLYQFYDPADAQASSQDLIQRIDTSDERIQRLADTPLMTTIFTIIHRPEHRFPDQRAEIYDKAVDTLLSEVHRGQDSPPLPRVIQDESQPAEEAVGQEDDPALKRTRLGLIAFSLHDLVRGEEGMPESDLIEQVRRQFPTVAVDEAEKKAEIRAFLYQTAFRGGLIEEQDCNFAFRTHRTFQEFLAGWYLVSNYQSSDLDSRWRFIEKRLQDDHWKEPLRLAAGYLAIAGAGEANAFIQKLLDSGRSADERDYAAALAGLSLVDLPPTRVHRPLRE